jgi:hypothetical protein
VLEETVAPGPGPAGVAPTLGSSAPDTGAADGGPPSRDDQTALPRGLDEAPVPTREDAANDSIEPARPAESVAIVPLAPNGLLPHAVYRLELPTIAALEQFCQLALGSGGVFVRTADLRLGGTPAVVCVVHPQSRDEFHIPGVIVMARHDRRGVTIKFAGVTSETIREFRLFIAQGGRELALEQGHAISTSRLTLVSRAARRPEPGVQSPIPSDTRSVAPSSIEPYSKR